MTDTWRLNRQAYMPKSTYSDLIVPDHPKLVTVEQPWRNNQPYKSCVPVGDYKLSLYYSPKRKRDVILLLNNELLALGLAKGVPRSFIEMHTANWAYQLRGCMGPGDAYNTSWGVANSRDVMKMLVARLEEVNEDAILEVRNDCFGGVAEKF